MPPSPEVREFSDVQRKLLIAAERLFAQRGVADVSLREIGSAAEQRNNSAVQYHFKTKTSLIVALYDFRLIPLNRRRLAMLAELADPTFAELVAAYICPLGSAVVDSGGSNSYARFIHRYLSEGAGDFEPFADRHNSAVKAITTQLLHRLPHADRRSRDERIRQMQQLVTSVLADLERRLEHGQTTRLRAAAAVDGLVSGTVAFLLAD